MSRGTAGKRLGKIFALLAAVLLLCAALAYWFIGGQTRAAEKYFSAIASGNYKNFEQVTYPYEENSFALMDDFKRECRYYFASLPEFADLSETDVITSKVRIRERRMDGSIDRWVLTADVDFFSGGDSVSYDGLAVTMVFDGGKWRITGV